MSVNSEYFCAGRTHQIRVHLAASGHPIVGDSLYGITGSWVSRQALHASTLTVEHPVTGRELTLQAPLPDDMLELAAQCGLAVPKDFR